MKAEIDADGQLTVSSETALESYALRKWLDENGDSLFKIKFTYQAGHKNEEKG